MNTVCTKMAPAPAMAASLLPTTGLHTILLATDLCGACEDVARLAGALARGSSARLIVLHVTPNLRPLIAYGKARVQLNPMKADRDRLWQRLRRVSAPGADVHLEHVLAEGDPATEILRSALPCLPGQGGLLMGSGR